MTTVQRSVTEAPAPGKRSVTEAVRPPGPVQRIAVGGAPDAAQVHAAAQRGVESPTTTLPHEDRIQASFGRHDVSGIQSHVGGPAAEAAESMGATAYAAGNHAVFSGAPDLHTAAHEAAHVVQQRAGVQLKGGVGEVGDPHEQHADAVADKVVRGESAEGLLDAYGGGGRAKQAPARHGLAAGSAPTAAPAAAGVAAHEDAGAEAMAPAMTPEDSVQLITHTPHGGAPAVIDINTLDDAGCRAHLARIGRINAAHPVGNDAEYAYDAGDRAAIQARQAALLEQRRQALVAALDAQLAALATAADHQAQPPWNGHNPGPGGDNEVAGAAVQPADAATIVAAWAAFLGAGPYSHKHPRTGVVDNTRLVSSDGQRSIRYGNHERNSTANNHHFHQETWTYNAGANTVSVANTIRRARVQ